MLVLGHSLSTRERRGGYWNDQFQLARCHLPPVSEWCLLGIEPVAASEPLFEAALAWQNLRAVDQNPPPFFSIKGVDFC